MMKNERRKGEGEKGDPWRWWCWWRCASYVCAWRAQRDSKPPPGIRPRDKCVPRRETKRVTTRRHSLSRFQVGTGVREGGRGIAVFETNEISGERHLLLHSLSGSVCHYSRGIRVAKDIPRFPFRKLLSKGISSRGQSRGQNTFSSHPRLFRDTPRLSRNTAFERAMILIS